MIDIKNSTRANHGITILPYVLNIFLQNTCLLFENCIVFSSNGNGGGGECMCMIYIYINLRILQECHCMEVSKQCVCVCVWKVGVSK